VKSIGDAEADARRLQAIAEALRAAAVDAHLWRSRQKESGAWKNIVRGVKPLSPASKR
jgi:hypothetical protein